MVVVGVGMVDLLCVVAGSVPAGVRELSVRARQRGGRPHPPNRGGTAETGQENLGVSRASRPVAGHRRLRGRTAPGLLEGSPGAGAAGEPCDRASPSASGIAGHRRAGGNVARGVAWISFGRGGGSHREQADPGRIWTSVLAVLGVPGGRARASTRRTGGSGPKINKRSSRKSGAGSRGAGVGTRVTTYEPAAESRSATNSLRPLLPRSCRRRAPRRERTVQRGVIFVMGAHDRPTARQRTGMRPRSVREVKGSSKILFSPRCPGQRVDSATRPILGPVPGRRITSGPVGKTPAYRWAP